MNQLCIIISITFLVLALILYFYGYNYKIFNNLGWAFALCSFWPKNIKSGGFIKSDKEIFEYSANDIKNEIEKLNRQNKYITDIFNRWDRIDDLDLLTDEQINTEIDNLSYIKYAATDKINAVFMPERLKLYIVNIINEKLSNSLEIKTFIKSKADLKLNTSFVNETFVKFYGNKDDEKTPREADKIKEKKRIIKEEKFLIIDKFINPTIANETLTFINRFIADSKLPNNIIYLFKILYSLQPVKYIISKEYNNTKLKYDAFDTSTDEHFENLNGLFDDNILTINKLLEDTNEIKEEKIGAAPPRKPSANSTKPKVNTAKPTNAQQLKTNTAKPIKQPLEDINKFINDIEQHNDFLAKNKNIKIRSKEEIARDRQFDIEYEQNQLQRIQDQKILENEKNEKRKNYNKIAKTDELTKLTLSILYKTKYDLENIKNIFNNGILIPEFENEIVETSKKKSEIFFSEIDLEFINKDEIFNEALKNFYESIYKDLNISTPKENITSIENEEKVNIVIKDNIPTSAQLVAPTSIPIIAQINTPTNINLSITTPVVNVPIIINKYIFKSRIVGNDIGYELNNYQLSDMLNILKNKNFNGFKKSFDEKIKPIIIKLFKFICFYKTNRDRLKELNNSSKCFEFFGNVKDKIDKLENQIKQFEIYKSASDLLDNKQKEIDILSNKLANDEKIINNINKENITKIKNLTSELEANNLQIINLNSIIKQLGDSDNINSTGLRDCVSQKDRLNSENIKLLKEIEQLKLNLYEKEREIRKLKNDNDQEVSELKNKIKEADIIIKNLENDVKFVEDVLARNNESIKNVKLMEEGYRNDIINKNKQIKDLIEKNNTDEKFIISLKDDIEKEKNNNIKLLEDHKIILDNFEKEKKYLLKQIENINTELSNKLVEIDEFVSDIDILKSKINNLEKNIENDKKSISMQITYFISEKDLIEKDINNLSDEYKDINYSSTKITTSNSKYYNDYKLEMAGLQNNLNMINMILNILYKLAKDFNIDIKIQEYENIVNLNTPLILLASDNNDLLKFYKENNKRDIEFEKLKKISNSNEINLNKKIQIVETDKEFLNEKIKSLEKINLQISGDRNNSIEMALLNDIQSLNDKISSMREKYENIINNIESNDDSLIKLQNENDNLKLTISNLTEKYNNDTEQLNKKSEIQTESYLIKFNNDIDNLLKDIDEYENMINIGTGNNNKEGFQKRKVYLLGVVKSLFTRITNIQEQNDEYKKIIITMENNINKLTNDILDKDIIINELKEKQERFVKSLNQKDTADLNLLLTGQEIELTNKCNLISKELENTVKDLNATIDELHNKIEKMDNTGKNYNIDKNYPNTIYKLSEITSMLSAKMLKNDIDINSFDHLMSGRVIRESFMAKMLNKICNKNINLLKNNDPFSKNNINENNINSIFKPEFIKNISKLGNQINGLVNKNVLDIINLYITKNNINETDSIQFFKDEFNINSIEDNFGNALNLISNNISSDGYYLIPILSNIPSFFTENGNKIANNLVPSLCDKEMFLESLDICNNLEYNNNNSKLLNNIFSENLDAKLIQKLNIVDLLNKLYTDDEIINFVKDKTFNNDYYPDIDVIVTYFKLIGTKYNANIEKLQKAKIEKNKVINKNELLKEQIKILSNNLDNQIKENSSIVENATSFIKKMLYNIYGNKISDNINDRFKNAKTLVDKFSILSFVHSNYINDIKNKISNNSELLDEIERIKMDNVKLEKSLNIHMDTIKKYGTQIEKLQINNDENINKVREMETKIQNIKNEKKSKDNILQAKNAEITGLETLLKRTTTSVDLLKNTNNELNSNLQITKNINTDKLTECANNINRINNIINQLKQRREEIKDKLINNKNENEEINTKLKVLNNEKNLELEKYNLLNQEYTNLLKQNSEITKQNSEITKQINDVTEEYSILQEINNKFKSDIEQITNEKINLEEVIDDNMNEISNINKSKKELENIVLQQTEDIKNMSNELDKIRQETNTPIEYNKCKEIVNKYLNIDIDNLIKLYNDCKADNIEKEDIIEKINLSNKDLSERLKENGMTISQYVQKNKQLEDFIEQINKENDNITKKYNIANEQIEEYNSEILNLKQIIEESKNINNDEIIKLRQIKNKYNNSMEKILDMKSLSENNSFAVDELIKYVNELKKQNLLTPLNFWDTHSNQNMPKLNSSLSYIKKIKEKIINVHMPITKNSDALKKIIKYLNNIKQNNVLTPLNFWDTYSNENIPKLTSSLISIQEIKEKLNKNLDKDKQKNAINKVLKNIVNQIDEKQNNVKNSLDIHNKTFKTLKDYILLILSKSPNPLDEIKLEHINNINKIKEDYEYKIENIKNNYMNDTNMLNEDYNNKLNKEKIIYENKLNDISNEYKEEIKKITNDLQNNKDNNLSLTSEYENNLQNLTNELNNSKETNNMVYNDYEIKIKNVNDKFQKEKEDIDNQYKKIISDNENKYTEIIKSIKDNNLLLSKRISEIENEKEETIKMLNIENEENLKLLNELENKRLLENQKIEDGLKQNIIKLETENQEIKNSAKEIENNLQNEITNINNSLVNVKSDEKIIKLNNLIKKYAKMNISLSIKNNTLKSKIENILLDNTKLLNQYNECKEDKTKIANDYKNNLAMIDIIKTELDNIKQELEKYKNNNNLLSIENTQLSKDIIELQTLKMTMTIDIDSLKVIIENHKNNEKISEQIINKLTKDIDNLISEKNKLINEKETFLAEKVDCTDIINKYNNKITELEKINVQMLLDNGKLKNEIDNLKKSITNTSTTTINKLDDMNRLIKNINEVLISNNVISNNGYISLLSSQLAECKNTLKNNPAEIQYYTNDEYIILENSPRLTINFNDFIKPKKIENDSYSNYLLKSK